MLLQKWHDNIQELRCGIAVQAVTGLHDLHDFPVR